jgi:hypothetical protein
MQYDHFGAQVSARFQFYLSGILGAYSARVAAGNGPNNVGDFRNTCYALLIGLGNDVRKLARDYLATLPNGGHEAGMRAFEAYMDAVAQQPIITLANRLQQGVQSVGNVLTRGAGSLGALIQRRLAAPVRLTARDSAGRAWQIEKLVPVMARDFAYQAYISDHLERARVAGAEKVDIVYADPARNLTLTLRDAFARRTALFHVNATAMIGSAHVPS